MEKAPDMIAAVRAQDVRAVKRLLAEDATLASARSEQGESAVLLAIQGGAGEIAELLIERGAALDVFSAAAAGHLAALERACAADRAAVGATSTRGWTALHLAAFFGRADAARLLIERGAALEAPSRNPSAHRPLHVAAARGHRAVAELLLERGADVNALAGGGWAPLHLAAGAGHEELAALLIERGANLAAREDQGRTPLEIAEEAGHRKLVAIIRRALR